MAFVHFNHFMFRIILTKTFFILKKFWVNEQYSLMETLTFRKLCKFSITYCKLTCCDHIQTVHVHQTEKTHLTYALYLSSFFSQMAFPMSANRTSLFLCKTFRFHTTFSSALTICLWVVVTSHGMKVFSGFPCFHKINKKTSVYNLK